MRGEEGHLHQIRKGPDTEKASAASGGIPSRPGPDWSSRCELSIAIAE